MHELHLVPKYSTNLINYYQSVLERLLNILLQKLSVQRLDEKYKGDTNKNWKNFYKIPNMKQQRQKMNCERYGDVLWNWLKSAIKNKIGHGLLSSGVCLQHNNARPHMACHIMK